jgi:hypothetical protein
MNASQSPEPILRCAECARAILRDPIVLDDQGYCCLGCLAGGPCICDDAEAAAAPESPSDLQGFELEIGPFRGQADLMHLAVLLERQPNIAGVALVVADPRRARFAMRAPSAQSVAYALASMPDYEAQVTVSGRTVQAVVSTRQAAAAAPRPEEALLPPRTRFRVFHNVQDPIPDDRAFQS